MPLLNLARYSAVQPMDELDMAENRCCSTGFFGVFDGHGGQQCSAFVARRLTEAG